MSRARTCVDQGVRLPGAVGAGSAAIVAAEAAERITGLEVGEATPISGRLWAGSQRRVAVASGMGAARPKPLAGSVHDRPRAQGAGMLEIN